MEKKGSWIVRVKQTVVADFVVEDCTEEEAKVGLWDCNITEETVIEQVGWEVQSVNPNE